MYFVLLVRGKNPFKVRKFIPYDVWKYFAKIYSFVKKYNSIYLLILALAVTLLLRLAATGWGSL